MILTNSILTLSIKNPGTCQGKVCFLGWRCKQLSSKKLNLRETSKFSSLCPQKKKRKCVGYPKMCQRCAQTYTHSPLHSFLSLLLYNCFSCSLTQELSLRYLLGKPKQGYFYSLFGFLIIQESRWIRSLIPLDSMQVIKRNRQLQGETQKTL